MDPLRTDILTDIISFYATHPTEDGIHPGVGWVYCEEEKEKYNVSQEEFDLVMQRYLDEGFLLGKVENEGEGKPLHWHSLMPTERAFDILADPLS